MQVFDANPKVNAKLAEAGALLSLGEVTHSYPHCWRLQGAGHLPGDEAVVHLDGDDGLREKTSRKSGRSAGSRPGAGADRGMIANRPDWCISRQRAWGVPIAIFQCEGCGRHLLDRKLVDHVAGFFEKEGADAWFGRDAAELLPPGTACPGCGGGSFRKETDILDVWFDSGVSYACVCEGRRTWACPWTCTSRGRPAPRLVPLSILAAVGTRGIAPYRSVLTHGFVVDGKGEAMSKSKGTSSPERGDQAVRRRGLRLWVGALDYRNDNPLSREILERIAESYRKIRNTVRYLLASVATSPRAATTCPWTGWRR